MHPTLFSRALPNLRRAALTNARHLATKPPGPQPFPSKQASQSSSKPASGDAAKASQPPSDFLEESSPTATEPVSPTSLSLDFSPIAESSGTDEQAQRTGARSSRDSLSSNERRRRFMGRATLAAFGLGALVGTVYLGREWEEDELKSKKLRIEDAPSTRFGRTKERFTGMFDFFSKPTWDELLPPSVPPFAKPYTLLLSIDDLLVTSTWDRQNGWRTAKRPGVDYFLAYMSQFFEIVVFTTQNHYTAIPVIEKLDPYSFFITYKLFRESTRSINGSIVKDLSYLNRDLSKVIMLDTEPEHVKLQPENAIVVPKWKGDPTDKGLVAMIPFLESIAIYNPKDVRPILKAYEGKNIPIEYGKKEAEAKRLFLEEWKKSGKSKVASGGGLTLSGLFGASSSESHGPEPLTYLEQKRKEAQAHYLEEQAYIAANREHFDKLIEEDRRAAEAAMSGNLWSVMASIGGGPPPQQLEGQKGGAKGKEGGKEGGALAKTT